MSGAGRDAIADSRTALLRQDAATLALVTRRWRVVQARLQTDIDLLVAKIAAADAPKVSWLQREQRYRDFLAQVETLVETNAAGLEPAIRPGQEAAVTMALEHAQGLVVGQLGDRVAWNRLPREATEALIGTLQDGSPLSAYLRQFGPAAAEAAEAALIQGVATGQGVKVIQRQLEGIFGVRGAVDPGLIGRKAMMTARSAVLGAYRHSSLSAYRANADLLEGWTWISSLQPGRTCVICWAKHGSVHPVDEPFVSHLMCRCTPAPRTKSWAALGFVGIPETRLEVPAGSDVFARLSLAQQLQVLGPTKQRLWSSGVPLSAMVAETDHPRWGKGLRERSARELMA